MNNKSQTIIDHYGNIKFWLSIAPDSRDPEVVDFKDNKVRENLINPNKVVIKDEKITMLVTYPLSVEVKIPLEKKGGFTRLDLFKSIYEAYKKIYEEEEKEVGDPGTYENIYNRKKSEGKYGIWGHYLEELIIEGVSYDPKEKILYLLMGS